MADQDSTKCCTKCSKRLSLDNFSKAGNGDQLRGDCKACKSAFELARNAARRAADGPPPEFKACTKCGESKRFVKPIFKTRSAAPWGLSPECAKCLSAREVARVQNSQRAQDVKKAWRQKNAHKIRAASSAWQKRNRPKCAARMAAWRAKNPERAYENASRAYVARRDEILQRHADWRANNKDLVATYTRNYKARKLSAGGSHTKADVLALLRLQHGKCAACCSTLDRFEVDHIEALSKGGANDKSNLQLLCRTCNRRKAARHPVDFMRLMGKLL